MTTVLDAIYADRLGEVVDAGSKEQIASLVELGIEGRGGIDVGVRDIERAQRQRAAGS